MSDQSYQHLKEQSWRRKLTPAQEKCLQDYLSAHTEARQDWEQETRLNKLLRDLPRVAVSSNFTARVMQAAQRTPLKKTSWLARMISPFDRVTRWLPRYAAAALVASGVALVSFHQYQVRQHLKIASDFVKVSQVAEYMKDFETIDRLSRVQVSDGELLSALR